MTQISLIILCDCAQWLFSTPVQKTIATCVTILPSLSGTNRFLKMDNRELELVCTKWGDQQIHRVIKLDLIFELNVNLIMRQYLMAVYWSFCFYKPQCAVRSNIDRGMGHSCDENVPEKNARKTSAQVWSPSLIPWKTQRIRCYWKTNPNLKKVYEHLTLYRNITALYYRSYDWEKATMSKVLSYDYNEKIAIFKSF